MGDRILDSRKFLAVTIAAIMVMGSAPSVFADSVMPATVMVELGSGDTIEVEKWITITEGIPTSSKVDVCFLVDSTGSMAPLINSVKASAAAILASTAALGDVQFCVAEYRDIFDAFVFRFNQPLTGNQAAVQNGINMWFASGGGDFFEANMFGLESTATGTPWRADSTRILVWFGDAPGHDPRMGSTEVSATAALVANRIIVEALDLGGLDLTGQATRITAATGGNLFAGINTGNIVTEISNAIMAAFMDYSKVEMKSDCDPNLIVTYNPPNFMGDFDRSIDREFHYTETIEGVIPGEFHCEVMILVDGGSVAIQEIWNGDMTRIGGTFIPIDSTALLLAGIQTNAVWIISALVIIGSLAFGTLYITAKKN